MSIELHPDLDTVPGQDSVADVDRRKRRNIAKQAIRAIKAEQAAKRAPLGRAADRLNDRASSTPFLVLHALWFAIWIPWNMGAFGLRPFDPFPFGLLTMVVSLEAIILAIFVLMAQKREAAIAELREELSLQVSLRLEQEVTKTLQLVAGLYTRLGHKVAEDPELQEMLKPLDVAGIERELTIQILAASQLRHR
ncbi:MAG: DUF1003 domain-containing protein [Gemmatimonadaceae bacterium]